jgi:hypothetical protein
LLLKWFTRTIKGLNLKYGTGIGTTSISSSRVPRPSKSIEKITGNGVQLNPRITKKERALLQGAVRRVFARSELRNKVLNAALIEHYDPARPRVTKWILCPVCNKPAAKYECQVDHIKPIVAVTEVSDAIPIGEFVDREWCPEDNLQPM